MKYSQVKNPKWANAQHTVIECEVDFDDIPEEDWTPFGAVASGDRDYTHQIFAECAEGKWGPIAEYVPPPPPKPFVPESITRRQCARQLLIVGMITGDEAIAMTQSGIPPASVQAYLNTLSEPDKTLATIDFAADNYYRNNPLLAALMVANNMSDEQVDDFFREASKN